MEQNPEVEQSIAVEGDGSVVYLAVAKRANANALVR